MAGNDGFTFGMMIGQRRNLANQAQTIQEMDDELGDVKQTVRAQAAEIAQLKLKLAVAEAGAEAITAQASALLKQHPDTPLLKDSGVAWKSKPYNKTLIRRIYEEAFDAAARKRGVVNPVASRTD